ncbi:MAG: molybdenum cofactor biosynthesis protein MoaE [Gemmatimonadaceae bacterium]
MIRAAITAQSIETQRLIDEVSSPDCGASAIFLGTVRSTNLGRSVNGIEYSAYTEMAEAEMRRILDEAITAFDIRAAVVEHRVGELTVGDVAIAAVVTHPHRGPALDAVRFIVDETKKRAPIWKRERYADGSTEWVGAAEGVVE